MQHIKMPHFKNAIFQNYHISKMPHFKNATFQKCHISKMPHFKNATFQKCHISKMLHFKNATFQTGFSRRRIRTRHSSSGPQRRAHVRGRTLQGRRHPKPEVVAKSRQTRGPHFRQRRRPVDAQPARLRSGAKLIKLCFLRHSCSGIIS
jgi:hypothetical protein